MHLQRCSLIGIGECHRLQVRSKISRRVHDRILRQVRESPFSHWRNNALCAPAISAQATPGTGLEWSARACSRIISAANDIRSRSRSTVRLAPIKSIVVPFDVVSPADISANAGRLSSFLGRRAARLQECSLRLPRREHLASSIFRVITLWLSH
jgi:hypothetical protein